MLKGYRDWKHATEAKKGFPRHADSRDNLACCIMWKKENRSTNSKEISTLLNSNAIERNKYISSLIDVIEFLATHQLAFRGRVARHFLARRMGAFSVAVKFFHQKGPSVDRNSQNGSKKCYVYKPWNPKWAYWRDEQYCQRSDCARGRRFVVYLKSWRYPRSYRCGENSHSSSLF